MPKPNALWVSFKEFEKEFFEKVRRTSLIKRFVTSEEVASMVTYIWNKEKELFDYESNGF